VGSEVLNFKILRVCAKMCISSNDTKHFHLGHLGAKLLFIAKYTKVDMIWFAGRNPTLVSHSLRGVAMNLKATTLTYLAIYSHFY